MGTGDAFGPEREESKPHSSEFQQALASLPNADLLASLDEVLLELERRLLKYARAGHEILEMANEGLVLSVRAAARLRQAQSSAQHAAAHLQVVGVGEWRPGSTNPSWNDDARLTGGGDIGEHTQ